MRSHYLIPPGTLSRSAITIAILTAAAVASASVPTPNGLSPWNIEFGVAAGIVLVGGARFIPAVVAGSLLGAWLMGWQSASGSGPVLAVVCALVAAGVGSALRRATGADPGRWTVRDVTMVIASALVAAAAVMACNWIRAAAGPPPSLDAADYFKVGVGIAVGIILGVPAVASAACLAAAPGPVRRRLVGADVVLHMVFILGVGAAAYVMAGPSGERFWSVYFIPLVWVAFRFGMHGVIAAHVLVSLQALALADLVATPGSALTNYHFFLFNFAATGVLFAATLGARQQAETARTRSEALLAGAFRIMDDAVVLVRSDDGEILDVNEAGLRLFGLPREAIAGASFFTLPAWHDGSSEALRPMLRARTPVRELPARIRRPDGAVRDAVMVAESVDGHGGAFAVVFVRDVTDSRLMARQRLQSQKLEAVGLLAGGVAHDFNNILAVVTAAGTMIRDETAHGDPRHEDIASILDAANRGAQLTRQLLTFSRHGTGEPSAPQDAAAAIGGMLGILTRLLGSGVAVEADLTPGVTIMAPPGHLEQVVLNLAVNARDAMEGRGTLRLALHARDMAAAELVREVGSVVSAGRWGVLTISDTGAGMDATTLSRIFEPFFTTKPEGKGTGLGLATVYGIVQGAGGHVGVRSAVGEGTAFIVYWPGLASGLESPNDRPASLVPDRVDR
jgi:two-component system cell cycle sensor histidine kinase/response regulator CckA